LDKRFIVTAKPVAHREIASFPQEYREEEPIFLDSLAQEVGNLQGRLVVIEKIELKELKEDRFVAGASTYDDVLQLYVNLDIISLLSRYEREFVFLHEISHIKNCVSQQFFFIRLISAAVFGVIYGCSFILLPVIPIVGQPNSSSGNLSASGKSRLA